MDIRRENRMVLAAKRHRYALLAAAVVVWIAVVCLFVFPARFEQNDDTAMAAIVYGANGQYDSHLVFINVLIGAWIKACLQVFPSVPWYTVFQCALVLLSFGVLVYLLFERFGIRKALIPVGVLLFYFGNEFLSLLQFSKTAGIASLAGILLIFHTAVQRRHWSVLILAGFLTVMGSMYRFSVFLMLLAPLFGVGVFLLLPRLKERDWRGAARLCLPVILVFGLCFGLRVCDLQTYQSSPEWAEYVEYNNLRSLLLDYSFPDYNTHRELYESLGISERDLALYQQWDFDDPDNFTIDTLRELVAAREKRQLSVGTVKSFLVEMVPGLIDYSYFSVLVIAGALFCFHCQAKRLLLLLYEVLALAGVEFYLYMEGRYLVNRIDAPLILAVFMVLMLYCQGDLPPVRRRVAGVLAGVILVVPLVTSFKQFNGLQQPSSETAAYQTMATDREHLYLCNTFAFMEIPGSIWDMNTLGEKSNFCALGGWTTHSPVREYILSRYGVENSFRDVVDNPEVYLVCTGDYKLRQDYIQTHFDPDAGFHCVKLLENTYPVYRVTTLPPVLDEAGAVDGAGYLHYDLQCVENGGQTEVEGYIYAEGVNSFASNIYIGIQSPAGEEQLYFATQRVAEFSDDVMNGKYAAFSCTLPSWEEGSRVTIYLETGEVLYRVDMGQQ